ncbi:MAG: C1 family peptidase [Pirellulales bacterium]|nr:C1 family peptidase [Pirellulales bacterium]
MMLRSWTTTLGLLTIFLATTAPAMAAKDGALSPQIQKQLRNSLKMDAPTRALRNALTTNDAKDLALNREIVQKHSNLFSHKLKAKGITNQQHSGRCWLFASLNVMRPLVIEKHKLDGFEFSESYLSFWDKLEKANWFLEIMIDMSDREPFDRELDYFMKDPITDGGWWDFSVALVEKYGVVPKSVMPESHASSNTDVMNRVLAKKLRVDAMKIRKMRAEKKPIAEIRAAKKRMLAEVYRILVLNFGEPPTEFTYRYVDKKKKVSEPKTYTPQSFYKEWVGIDLSQYVHLCDDPTQSYGKHYKMRRIRNIVGTPEVHYVNVPVDTLRKLASKSLLDDEPVLFGGDALQDMDRAQGIMQVGLYDYSSLYGVDLNLSKKDQFVTRDEAVNHMMLFVGIDMDGDAKKGKPAKWLVENSWGADRGDKGYWTLYDEWFSKHVHSIIIKKAYVPNNILREFRKPAVDLPPWTPMNMPSR